jgi:hypothetical protein
MEEWKAVVFWLAIGASLASGTWNLIAAIRYRRKVKSLDRETWGMRPLLPEGQAATLRDGDALLLVLPEQHLHDGEYLGAVSQQVRMLEGRGIRCIAFPEGTLEKAVVVPRSALPEHHDDADDSGHNGSDGGSDAKGGGRTR